jgi:spore germination protein KC
MKRTRAISLLLFIVMLPLNGCWDHTEMNDLAMVMAVGYDLTSDGRIQATLQMAVPKEDGGKDKGGGNFTVQSMSGRTMHDAFLQIQEQTSRRLYEGHRRVVLIGEDLARHGIEQLFDQLSRDPNSRFHSYILICKGTTAKDILQKSYPYERVPSEAIRELAKSHLSVKTTLRDCLLAAVTDGIAPTIAAIEPMPQKKKQDITEPFNLTGTALMRNFKLIGYLDDRETRTLLWIIGERSKGVVTAYVPEGSGYVSIEMNKESSKVTTKVIGDKVLLGIKIKSKAMVHENNTKLDLNKPANLAIAERAISLSIKKRIESVIRKSQQEYDLDVVGFGREIYRHDLKQWNGLKEHWDQKYASAATDIDVELQLTQLGLTRTSLQHKEHKQ